MTLADLLGLVCCPCSVLDHSTGARWQGVCRADPPQEPLKAQVIGLRADGGSLEISVRSKPNNG